MVFPKDRKIWTDWEWIEPNYPYSLADLPYYMFKRMVGRMTDDGCFLAYEEIRIVPVENF